MNDSTTQSVLFPNLFSKPVRASIDQDNSSSDGGFANPQLLDFLEQQELEYLVAIARNARLERRARRLTGKASMMSSTSGATEQVFGETLYAAKNWSHRRRIIIKAEVVRHPWRDPKNNPRFVVTNLPHKPENAYQTYRHRGDSENRIKELHPGLELDRTSCSSFWANQLRVLMTAAACVLMQEMRRLAQVSNSQFQPLRTITASARSDPQTCVLTSFPAEFILRYDP